jgi:glycosyltransferase involved in cell wall biosynthesis
VSGSGDPPVSVVIPCYNQGHFLDEAITSALGQAYRPVEVIVVDDGSADRTGEVAHAWGVRCLRQANRGLPAARNAGLAASTGEYVVFLDADDRLLPGALEVGAAALARHPEAAFAVGRHRRIAADGSRLPTPVRPRVDRDHYVSLVRACWIAMPATVMHRHALLRRLAGFDPAFRHAEDYELYLRLARRSPIFDHYTEVAEYRQHADTLSRSAEPMLVATLRALRAHRPGPGATPAHRAAYRARDNAVWYFDRLLESAVGDLRAGRWGPAGRALLAFGRHLPQHPAYARRRLGTPFRLAARALGRA